HHVLDQIDRPRHRIGHGAVRCAERLGKTVSEQHGTESDAQQGVKGGFTALAVSSQDRKRTWRRLSYRVCRNFCCHYDSPSIAVGGSSSVGERHAVFLW